MSKYFVFDTREGELRGFSSKTSAISHINSQLDNGADKLERSPLSQFRLIRGTELGLAKEKVVTRVKAVETEVPPAEWVRQHAKEERLPRLYNLVRASVTSTLPDLAREVKNGGFSDMRNVKPADVEALEVILKEHGYWPE